VKLQRGNVDIGATDKSAAYEAKTDVETKATARTKASDETKADFGANSKAAAKSAAALKAASGMVSLSSRRHNLYSLHGRQLCTEPSSSSSSSNTSQPLPFLTAVSASFIMDYLTRSRSSRETL
jgi:hypothetical protein